MLSAELFSQIVEEIMQSKLVSLLTAATLFGAVGSSVAGPREVTDPVDVRSGPGTK